jgi:hypothetical protein
MANPARAALREGQESEGARRFPPPWSVEEQDACFVVRDSNGQALPYICYETEAGSRAAD